MVPFLVANMASVMELQKYRIFATLKGIMEGTKLKLQDLAIIIAVASRSFVGSTQPQMTTFVQISAGLLFSMSKRRVLVGSEQGLSLRICH